MHSSSLKVTALAAAFTIFMFPAFAREWKDASGSFSIDAEYIASKGGKVYLEKPDGSVVKIALDKLSQADQEFLKSLPSGIAPPAGTPTPSATGDVKDDRTTIVPIKADEGAVGMVRTFGGEGWGIKSLAFSPNGGRLAVGKSDEALKLFDINTSDQLNFHDELKTLGQVTCVAFSRDGKKFMSGGYRGKIQIWEMTRDGVLLPRGSFPGHSGEVHTIATSGDSEFAFSGAGDKSARYWRISTGREEFSYDQFQRNVRATWVSSDNKFAIASDGVKAVLFDLPGGRAKGEMPVGKSVPQFVAISPDGALIAVQDGYEVHVWDTRSGKETSLLKDREIQWAGAFSADSKYLATGGSGVCNLWDVKKGAKVHTFDLKQGYTQSIAFSPDIRHVAATTSPLGAEAQVLRLPKLEGQE